MEKTYNKPILAVEGWTLDVTTDLAGIFTFTIRLPESDTGELLEIQPLSLPHDRIKALHAQLSGLLLLGDSPSPRQN